MAKSEARQSIVRDLVFRNNIRGDNHSRGRKRRAGVNQLPTYKRIKVNIMKQRIGEDEWMMKENTGLTLGLLM